MTATLCVAGIDVSKARLDVFVLPQRQALVFANDVHEIEALTRQLKRSRVQRVVVEATGGLEYPVARALADANVAVSRVQPGRVRAYRGFLGRRAKTDALDAELIARFAQAMPDDDIRALPSQKAEAIRSLSARRRAMVLLPAPTGPSIAITREDRERGASRPAPIRPPDRSPSDSNIVRHLAEPAVGRQNGEQARKTGKRSLHACHVSDRRLALGEQRRDGQTHGHPMVSPAGDHGTPQPPPALDAQAGPRHGDVRP